MTGRPLRGTITACGSGFTVSVPRERGRPARTSLTFSTIEDAQAWRTLAVAALNAGEPLPPRSAVEPEAAVTPVAPAQPLSAEADLETVAQSWIQERYVRLRRGEAGRRQQVSAIVANHLVPFFDDIAIASGSQLTRDAYVDFLTGMIAPAQVESSPVVSAGNLTIGQAAFAAGVSVSTIKRRRRAGMLPRSFIDAHGILQIPHTDLVAAGLRAATGQGRPVKRAGLSMETTKDIRNILDNILYHGRDAFGWTLAFDPAKIPNAQAPRVAVARRTQVSLTEAVAIAEHLHAVHQLALWLMRICGLRISEAYGLRLRDIVLDGDRGVIRIHRQGGRAFVIDGHDGPESVTSKDVTKTTQSVRVLVLPTQLVTLIRTVVEVFHTGPTTGIVDSDRRLVPGLTVEDESGQAAFREALKRAAQAADVSVGADPTDALSPVPHDLRKAAITDLAWTDLDPLIRKRWAGHSAGSDVHHRTYVLDHPGLKPFFSAAREIEALIDADCDGGLMIATTVSCTTGNQPRLHPRRDTIDAALLDAGWLIPAHSDGATLMNVANAADLLGASTTATRRWIAAHPDTQQRAGCHLIAVDIVMAERERRVSLRTVQTVARDLGVSCSVVYYWIRRDELDVVTTDGRIVVPEATERALKQLHAQHSALQQRSMSVADAAATLGVSVHAVDGLIRNGHLSIGVERGPRDARYVTRESVAVVAAQAQRRIG